MLMPLRIMFESVVILAVVLVSFLCLLDKPSLHKT